MTDFARELERARINAGLSLAEVARRSGLTAPGIRKALRGNPTLNTMRRLAAAVGAGLALTLTPHDHKRETVLHCDAAAFDADLELRMAA